jgi:hypothetical protein
VNVTGAEAATEHLPEYLHFRPRILFLGADPDRIRDQLSGRQLARAQRRRRTVRRRAAGDRRELRADLSAER